MRRCIPALLAVGLLLAGCSADPLNIVITTARAPGDKCDFPDDTKYVSRGSLDLTPYVVNGVTFQTQRFYQVFSWENNLQSIPISVGGTQIDPGAGNEFIADTAVYSYQYSDPSVVLSQEQANIRAVIPAGGTTANSSVPADLIQPKAFAAINASTAINTSGQTLVVTLQLFGKTLSGSSKHTNAVTFPITINRFSTTPLDCASLTPPQKVNGGNCNLPGYNQPVSCVAP